MFRAFSEPFFKQEHTEKVIDGRKIFFDVLHKYPAFDTCRDSVTFVTSHA